MRNKPAGFLDSMWSLNSFARCHSAWKVGTSHSFGASGYPPQFHGAKQGFCGRGCHRLLPLDWFLHDKERHLKTIPKIILDYGFHFFGVISEPEIQMSGCDEKTSCPSTPLSINWGILKGQQKILNGQISVRLPQCCFQFGGWICSRTQPHWKHHRQTLLHLSLVPPSLFHLRDRFRLSSGQIG